MIVTRETQEENTCKEIGLLEGVYMFICSYVHMFITSVSAEMEEDGESGTGC